MKRTTMLVTALAALGAGAALAQAPAPAGKPTIPQICTSCHQAQPGSLQGIFENVAFKSQAIQLKIDAYTEIVRFDPKTLKVVDGGVAKPSEALRDIAKNREARIDYVEKDGTKLATQISFKGPIKVAPEKLVNYVEVEQLVAQGPERGNYTLIDSRPLPRVQEGTIPTAINLPYPAWDKFVDRLPKDKNRFTIFFCQGVTCMMSPNSLRKAEALGYTNVKVYREGYPEWLERNIGVIAAPHLKEAWIDKEMPHVLVDARPASTAALGRDTGCGLDSAVKRARSHRRPSRPQAQGADHGLRRRRRKRGIAGGARDQGVGPTERHGDRGRLRRLEGRQRHGGDGNAANARWRTSRNRAPARSRTTSSPSLPRRRRRT